MSLSLCAALCAGWHVPAHGQDLSPAEWIGQPIVSVDFTGPDIGVMRPANVDLEPGSTLTREQLRSAIATMLDTERWADIQVDIQSVRGGIAVVFEMRPRSVLTRIDVIGNQALGEDEIRQLLQINPDSEVTTEIVESLVDRVTDHYRERGWLEAEVTIRLRETEDLSRRVMRIEIAEGEPLRVRRYRFIGDQPPSALDVVDEIGIGRDDVLDRSALETGIRTAEMALRRGGWLEARLGQPQIETVDNDAEVSVRLRLGPHYELRLEGHQPVSRSRLESALSIHESRLTRARLTELEEIAVNTMQKHGFHHARVEALRVQGARPDEAILLFRIQPGTQLRVVAFSFPGSSHFSNRELRSEVLGILQEQLPDTRLFGTVDSDTVDRMGLSGRQHSPRIRETPRPLELDPAEIFYAPAYEAAIEHLERFYESRGFLNASIGTAELRQLGRGRAIVSIPVIEGARTLLHYVRIEGNEVVSTRELLEQAHLRRGEPFSYLLLEEAIETVTDLYRERGYAYVRVEPTVHFSRNGERAEIVLQIVERFQVRIGEVQIEGTARTTNALIRDTLRFAEGDLYEPNVIQASREALMALGVFTSVAIIPDNPELPERVKSLLVRVSERPPHYTDLYAGISTGQGLRINGEYLYRNLFGYGISAAIGAQIGFQFLFQDQTLEENITSLSLGDRLERRITLSLTVPQLGDLDGVRTTLDLVHVRDNERSFGLDKNGVILSWFWNPVRTFQLVVSGELENNNITRFGNEDDWDTFVASITDPRIQRILRVPQGDSWVGSTRVQFSVDGRDSPFVPTEGMFASTTLEWASTISTNDPTMPDQFFNILKLGLTLTGYLPLGDWVFATQLRIGYIHHLEADSDTFPNRQYYMGGVDTLRGFNLDQVVPQDVYLQLSQNTGTPVLKYGGDAFYLLRSELRIPLFASLQLGLFLDLGNHWALTSEIFEDFTPRLTPGLGLRIATPFGLLAIDVGFNPDRRQILGTIDEPIAAFHFSIGTF